MLACPKYASVASFFIAFATPVTLAQRSKTIPVSWAGYASLLVNFAPDKVDEKLLMHVAGMREWERMPKTAFLLWPLSMQETSD